MRLHFARKKSLHIFGERHAFGIAQLGIGFGIPLLVAADGRRLEVSVNRALFDAEMLCLDRVEPEAAQAARGDIRRGIGQLLRDDSFTESIFYATADTGRLAYRLRAMARVFTEAGLPVSFRRIHRSP